MNRELIKEIHKYLDYIPDDLKPKPNELVGLLQRAYVELCQPNQTKWVSVDNELPEYADYVLTYGVIEGYRLISTGSLNTVGTGLPCGVTHWQPLPEPPRQ